MMLDVKIRLVDKSCGEVGREARSKDARQSCETGGCRSSLRETSELFVGNESGILFMGYRVLFVIA